MRGNISPNRSNQIGLQRILQHQLSEPNVLKNEELPNFSISPHKSNNKHESKNSKWLPNLDQPQQQQRNVSPYKSNNQCYECSLRIYSERLLNQQLENMQQQLYNSEIQNQKLQVDLENANRMAEKYKNEIEQLNQLREKQSILPIQQRYPILHQPAIQIREKRSLSDNRLDPQNIQQQSQKNFILFTCRLDEKNIETYYKNQQIHLINFIINRQDPIWECLKSNTFFQQNGQNYIQIQRKTQLNECYLLKGKVLNQYFQSIDDAAQSLLPQLIAKYFLNLFYKDLKSRYIHSLPQFNYSELFILQEIDKQQYWIAEKKYKDPFLKYNTRYGEICQNSNFENLNFLTAFSFFTYYTTYGNYIVLDIQGYGQNLTEPTINSKSIDDKFPNDQGQDKISTFLVKFRELKLGYKYLDSLQMKYYK